MSRWRSQGVGLVLVSTYLVTVGFGAAPSKKVRKIDFGGPKFQGEGKKYVFTSDGKEKAYLKTEDVNLTCNVLTVYFQEGSKNPQPGGEVAFDRIEAKGGVTLQANQPNATGSTPRKITATCASAVITQRAEQIQVNGETRSIRQKVVLRGDVNATTEIAPGSKIKGSNMKAQQATLATKTDGELLLLGEGAVHIELLYEEDQQTGDK